MKASSLHRTVGSLASVPALKFLAPLGVFGTAIGWPANLGLPAARKLLLISKSLRALTDMAARVDFF